jgi:replicative DNA helicase
MSDIEKRFLHELTRSTDNIKATLDALVSADYFLYPSNKTLFKIIKYNFEKYYTVLQSDTLQSLLGISQKLSQDDQAKISVLFEEVKLLPDASDFKVVIDEFKEYFKTNSIKQSLERAVSSLHDKAPDTALDQLKSDIVTLERALNSTGYDCGYFGNNSDKIIDFYVDAKAHPEKYKGAESGFKTIDLITNGFPKGTVTIIMGTSKSGKSVLMLNMAYHNMLQGKRVYYHVNEGGRILVQNRLICRATGLEMNKIERRTLSDAEFAQYSAFVKSLDTDKRICIDSVARSASTVSYIERKVDELKVDGPIDLIIVDYMSLMRPEDKTIRQGWEKLNAISMDLKDLAMKVNIPIVTIMHVNNEGAKARNDRKYFTLEDMGLSHEPAKNVDLIASWWVDDKELKATNRTKGVLSLQASRFCSQGDTTLLVDTSLMKIEEFDLTKVLH